MGQKLLFLNHYFKRKELHLNTTYQQLTQEERYLIYSYIKTGYSILSICKHLNRNPSTIYRELKHNTGEKGYCPQQAHRFAVTRRRYASKYTKMRSNIVSKIRELIRLEHSPEQISGRLSSKGIVSISHVTIYSHIRRDKLLGGDLYKHLRFSRFKRRKRYGKKKPVYYSY